MALVAPQGALATPERPGDINDGEIGAIIKELCFECLLGFPWNVKVVRLVNEKAYQQTNFQTEESKAGE